MLNPFAPIPSWIASHRRISTVIACAIGIAAAYRMCFDTPQAKVQRGEKELRALADRISTYGHNVHQRYPTGDVVVSERDLAKQFHKRPDSVATALNLLLGEQKVQRAPLNGYWKLNV